MLAKVCSLFLFFLFLTKPTLSAHIKPLDLVDDAEEKLKDLNQLVVGQSYAAQNTLNDLDFDVLTHRVNVRLNAEISINQESLNIDLQLSGLKELAGNADISSCLDGNEEQLEQLPEQALTQVQSCIAGTQTNSSRIVADANYNIAVVINSVFGLSFALGRCSTDDTACINTVIDAIDAAEVDLPKQIQAEVQNATDQLEYVKVAIQDCSDNSLSNYVLTATRLFATITECVNGIVS